MTTDASAPANEEEDEFKHGCLCCEMHVEKAAIVVGVIYFVVELYAVWNHFSDGNPTFPLCFFAISGLLVFGIWKKNRTALLVFLILLAVILVVEATLCFLKLPDLIADIENNDKPKTNLTVTTSSPEQSSTELIAYTTLSFLHLALRVSVGAYLFNVLLNFRKFILESPTESPTQPQPVVTAIRLEDYTAVMLEDAPPAYTSTD